MAEAKGNQRGEGTEKRGTRVATQSKAQQSRLRKAACMLACLAGPMLCRQTKLLTLGREGGAVTGGSLLGWRWFLAICRRIVAKEVLGQRVSKTRFLLLEG